MCSLYIYNNISSIRIVEYVAELNLKCLWKMNHSANRFSIVVVGFGYFDGKMLI